MPRVKIDYVVSFSSEDPDNPANNLLERDVSKKKWLCAKGEPSASVVLQLARAVKICAVQIGVHHAALVEVLVGRSEKPNDQYQVLVPRSVFVSPAESRRGESAEALRSFPAAELAAPAKEHKWDRVRVVCSQPYNKHCKYGLVFIQMTEPEGAAPAARPAPRAPRAALPALPARLRALDALSSDEEDFRPGELFAKRATLTSNDHSQPTSASTGAQIRQATSQALKNIPDLSSKLMKTPIRKTSSKPQQDCDAARTGARRRDDSLHTQHGGPQRGMPRVVPARREHTAKHETTHKQNQLDKTDNITNGTEKDKIKQDREKASFSKNADSNEHRKRKDDNQSFVTNSPETSRSKDKSSDRDKDNECRKKPPEMNKDEEPVGARSSAPHTVLAGVTLVLSGYENPRRAALRSAALALGARLHRDWGPACTHLICAFPNTPKLRQVRASPGGAHTPAVLGEWVEACGRARRRLPCSWFATEPARRVSRPDLPGVRADHEPDCDTDEEIEKVLRDQKKRRRSESPTPAPRNPTTTSKRARRASQSDEDKNITTPKCPTDRLETSRNDSDSDRTIIDSDHEPTDNNKQPFYTSANMTRQSPPTISKRKPAPRLDSDTTTDCDETPSKIDGDRSIGSNDTVGPSSISKARACCDRSKVKWYDASTDEETPVEDDPSPSGGGILPDFFEGLTFVVEEGVSAAGFDAALLRRYVTAYGGLVLDEDDASAVDIVVSRSRRGARPDWVWRCHAARAKLPPAPQACSGLTLPNQC